MIVGGLKVGGARKVSVLRGRETPRTKQVFPVFEEIMITAKIVRTIDMVRPNGMFLVVELGSELTKMTKGLSVM
jgi:hypothetical protein